MAARIAAARGHVLKQRASGCRNDAIVGALTPPPAAQYNETAAAI
jgi:hypothetical protein